MTDIVERVSSVAEGEKRIEQLDYELVRTMHSKALTKSEFKAKFEAIQAEREAVENGVKAYKRSMAFRAGSEIGQPAEPPPPGELVLGKHLNPLSFDTADLRLAHEAMSHGQRYEVRAKAGGNFMDNVSVKTPGTFSSPVSQLPPQLWPLVVHPEHENRLLDRLPATQIGAPSPGVYPAFEHPRAPRLWSRRAPEARNFLCNKQSRYPDAEDCVPHRDYVGVHRGHRRRRRVAKLVRVHAGRNHA